MDNYSSWQKLEPHSHYQDLSTGIKVCVYDPLWMLTRQWQLGEFEGEDSGSPIYVKVENRQDEISGVFINRDVFKYDDSMPLEVFVERIRAEVTTSNANGDTESQLDLQMQARLGLQFQSEMDVLLKNILVDTAELRRFKRFLAQDPALRFELNERQNRFEVEETKKFVSIVKGRIINIYKATENFKSPIILIRKIEEYFANNPNTDPTMPGAVTKAILQAIENSKTWWYGNREQLDIAKIEQPFFERPPENLSMWNPRHLEYDFKVQITPKDTSGNLTGRKLILDSSGYKEDHLDWYSFTVSDETTEGFELPLEKKDENPPQWPPYPIATRFKFAGMPEKRWWNFEDTYVDFGSINPKKNNIASILLMEFALVHSPDWFVVPCRMSVGSINKIDKLAVLDCFGEETIIEAAGNTKSELDMKKSKSWDSWGMFTLSEKYKDRDKQHYTPYFFLPPTIDYVLTGPPLEEVKFLRDETANLVWAVEKKYRTFHGEPVSGYDHSVLLQKKTTTDVLSSDDNEEGEESDKPLKYRLMTSVPRNWIPFIPVHTTKLTNGPSDPIHKHIELQRATMINPADQTCIRPNSRLLNEVQSPYYIDEEEVPRNGIIVSESCQWTVWHTGKTFLWISRKKFYGAGEGSSGLQFDSVPLKKNL